MRWTWALSWLGCCVQAFAGGGFGYLELRPSAQSDSLPAATLYLTYPEALGAVPVRLFLEAPEDKARALLKTALGSKPLSKSESAFLLSLRAVAEGHMSEAHEAMVLASKNLPRRLRSCQRVNTALLLYFSGLPSDAETEWKHELRDDGPAAEGAWRNLYSLYLGRKDFAKANGLVEEVLQETPDNQWAVAAKGYLLHMLAPDDDFGEFLREKSSSKDSLFSMQIAYGKFLKDREQWDEAAKYYNRGLEGNPGNGQAWLDLADIYYHQGYLVFAEKCIHNAFHYGVYDPYIFELYGRVLQDITTLADSGRALQEIGFFMRRLGFDPTPEWADELRQRAEKVLEEGLPQDLHSRSMAQLLYGLYCRNGKVEAAQNLRNSLWFHFIGPPPPAKPPRLGPHFPDADPHLRLPMSYVTYPLIRSLQLNDFFEPF